MKACWLLLLGGACAVFAADDAPTPTAVYPNVGAYLPLQVQTLPHTAHGCYLVTPNKETIQFMPEDNSDDNYSLDPLIPLSECRVIINNLNENDNGIWEIYFTDTNDTKVLSHFYDVTVTGGDEPEQGSDETNVDETENEHEPEDGQDPENELVPSPDTIEEENIETTSFATIQYGARLGVNISITLSNKNLQEECYLQAPQGENFKLEDIQQAGVQVYTTSTHFVSCRVIIGPIEESMLGTWTLCARRNEGQKVVQRCQPGNIYWAVSNPAANWDSRTLPVFDHPVHFGGTLTPLVRGTGTVNTCHVITPNGEDIAVSSTSDYPGLQFVVISDVTMCSIIISDIDANFIGDWNLYGTYNVFSGFNVISQPMSLFVYDEDDPFAQSYNVTTLAKQNHVVNEGLIITVENIGSGVRDGCQLVTNTGASYYENTIPDDLPVEFVENGVVGCILQVGPISSDMMGEWVLTGKYNNRGIFTEQQLSFNLILEDPANPIQEPDRQLIYFIHQDIQATIGQNHTFQIEIEGSSTVVDSCHIRTPDNLQYIMREGFNSLPGVEFFRDSRISCAVNMRIDNEDMIGDWMIISRVDVRGTLIEQRLPITINVEEIVAASSPEVTIAEGASLYLRLEEPATLPDTCSVIGPVRNNAELDEHFPNHCGFVIRDIAVADAGTWEIHYGHKIKYYAFVQVTVNARNNVVTQNLSWEKDVPLNETYGPENAIYCKVEDPFKVTVFEGFGRCHVSLDRVRSEHEGVWTMTVGTAGRVLTETHQFIVKLAEPSVNPEVTTSVSNNKPFVLLSCHLSGDVEVLGCKFQDPQGQLLLASRGVGEDRYSFNDEQLESNLTGESCGLRITNPITSDLGIWRCAMDTADGTYFGFINVLCPWSMSDPEIAATVVTEPTLTATTETVSVVEGDVTTLSCSVQAPIRYCYFRSQNGSIFNVSPGASGLYEYAGAGLDAGECGIRFPTGLQARDSGNWRCQVGFNDPKEPEQRAQIAVAVEDLMFASQDHKENPEDTLVVYAQVHSRRALEYCRFVRIDGIGFTTSNVPENYEDHSVISNGRCEIRVHHPTILEKHPWTVVAKIVGQDMELFRTTDHTMSVPDPEQEPHEPHPEFENVHTRRGFMGIWTFLFVTLILCLCAGAIAPKRNRHWVYRRANHLRNSIRRSDVKRPPIDENAPVNYNTPTAA